MVVIMMQVFEDELLVFVVLWLLFEGVFVRIWHLLMFLAKKHEEQWINLTFTSDLPASLCGVSFSELLVRSLFSSWDLITREQFAKTKKISKESESCNAALYDESFLSVSPSL
jgi:hypothetical protein